MQGNGRAAVTVNEAAEKLGITPRAVRFRLKKGTLVGTQLDGGWLVYLGERGGNASVTGEKSAPVTVTARGEETEEGEEISGGEREMPLPSPLNPERQLQAVMDSWLAPLTEKISVQAEEIGRLKAELAQAERERDAMVQALGDISHKPEFRPAMGFWSRLFGGV